MSLFLLVQESLARYDMQPEGSAYISCDLATKCDLIRREGDPKGRETTPKPSAWREVVAHWNTDMRQEWGIAANAKQDEGMSWQKAEWQAFWEVGARYSYDPVAKSYHPA